MPKVRASMAEVSTDFSPLEPGMHRYEVQKVEERVSDGEPERVSYGIKIKVVEVYEGDEADEGRSWTDRIHIHMKDGEVNEYGVAQLKRYFEVCIGEEEANDPDADTDWLINKQFKAETGIESYEVEDRLSGEKQKRQKNKIERMAPI